MPRKTKYTKRKKKGKTKQKISQKGGARGDDGDDGWNTDDSDEVWNERRKKEELLKEDEKEKTSELDRSSSEFVNLPEGWELKRTPSGRKYYSDNNTQTTQWEMPLEDSSLKASAPASLYQEEFDTFYPDMPEDIKKVRLKPQSGSLIDPKCTDNYDTSIKMIVGHGSLMADKFFQLPEGVKIITLSPTDVCIKAPPDISDVEPLLKYYIDGFTIFQEDDNKKQLEFTMDRVIDRYRRMGSRIYKSANMFNFQYGLHLPGDIFNETKIQLRGKGCDSEDIGGGFNCSVICFQKGTKDYKKIYHYKPGEEDLTGIDGQGKYELIKLSDMIEKMGKGTYILFTCRYFEGDEDQYALSKTFSAKNRGPGYLVSPDKPREEASILPGKKLYGLETVQPPESDLRRLKRLIIKEDKDVFKEDKNIYEQSYIEWLILEVWLNSNGFNFDGDIDSIFGDNFNLLKSIFNRMDENKDDIITLDDLIRVEIIGKDNEQLRNEYFNSISLTKVILFKIPEVLLRLCGNLETFQIEKNDFYQMITKAVKYSLGKNRNIHRKGEK